jgi:hypothetical protein
VILREACKLPLSRADRRVLVACTLVCKSWLPLAQSLLYHSVIVKAGSYYASTRTPGTCGPKALLEQSHVLEFTKSLSISVLGKSAAKSLKHLSNDLTPKGNQKRIRVPDFFALLEHTPQLRCLTLSVGSTDKNISPFESHILYWLPSLKLAVEVLDIQGDINGGDFLRSTFVYHLVRIWKTIQALRVVPGDVFDDGLPQDLERPSIRLRELRLRPTRSAEVIEWLLPPPPQDERSNLRFLELPEIPEGARTALSVHGPSVSSLTLFSQPKFEIAQLFTNLEELVITGICWQGLSAFPRTLKHIRLEAMAFVSDTLLRMSDTLVAAVAEELPTFPNLRVISIEEALTANKYYPDLQKACRTHKVEVLLIPRPNKSRRATLVSGSDVSATPLHLLTTATSIPTTSKWIAFLDYIPSPSSSTLGIEDPGKYLRLPGCETYDEFIV